MNGSVKLIPCNKIEFRAQQCKLVNITIRRFTKGSSKDSQNIFSQNKKVMMVQSWSGDSEADILSKNTPIGLCLTAVSASFPVVLPSLYALKYSLAFLKYFHISSRGTE